MELGNREPTPHVLKKRKCKKKEIRAMRILISSNETNNTQKAMIRNFCFGDGHGSELVLLFKNWFAFPQATKPL